MQNKENFEIIKDKEYQNELLLNILSCYLNDKEIKFDLSGADWNYLYSLSFKQGLGCILFKATEKIYNVQEDILKKLEYYYQKSLFSCAARNDLLLKISSILELNEIDFVILKGAVIQGYYPSPELRVMSDIDFLIHPEDRKKVKRLFEENNINFFKANSYQDIYNDSNDIIIEIHHALWGYDIEQTKLYSDVWNPQNLVSGKKHTYLLSNEDLYIFTIAHMYKHFRVSGIGIRPIFDIWFILKKNILNLDFNYIKSELSKFDAQIFERNIRNIVNSIFLEKEKSDETKIIIKYLLECDTHGTDEISAINEFGSNKFKNIIKKIFPPLSYMKRRYSALNKLPFLLPIFWLIRILSLPFCKNRTSKNIKKIKNSNSEKKDFIREVFHAAGIKNSSSHKTDFLPLAITLGLIFFLVLIFSAIFFQEEFLNHSEEEFPKESFLSEHASEDVSIDSESFYGTISWKGGIYTGYLVNNTPNGSGEHVVENKFRYVGVFSNGAYNGLGKIEYFDGSRYEGMFKDNQSNGEGTLYCANGDIISGTFTDGQPGGFCNYEYSDGNLFVGTMINGIKHGEGTFYWLNGDKYVGSFVDDLRDGYGILTYSNGDNYTGNWLQGFCSGYGVYTWKNGKKYEGLFENGIMNDTNCKITNPDGSVYEGEISEGIQNGKGTLTFSNGDIAKGNFVSGKLSGEAEYYYHKEKHWGKVIYEKGVIIKYIID